MGRRYVRPSDIALMRRFVLETGEMTLREVSGGLGLSTAFVAKWRQAFAESEEPDRALQARCRLAVQEYLGVCGE